jgi:hypothetical protein
MIVSFWYLATPYTKYPLGIDRAFKDASEQAAIFIRRGINVFSPIAHTHPIAVHGRMDPLDFKMWLKAQESFMKASCGVIFCKLISWEISYGMNEEKKIFLSDNKPLVEMEPNVLPDYDWTIFPDALSDRFYKETTL